MGRFVKLEKIEGVEGPNLKLWLRARAKRLPLYYLHVRVEPEVTGRTDTGVPIPVNTLGRWLWGVPGYMGNAVFCGWEGEYGVWLPREAPQEAETLILQATKGGTEEDGN